ncbi:hypothetical protein [Paralysiella testudinis]|uniref:Uncharacterized protein n=1 Tax=Paralysiella testudinis TaxID=2809020 RepID=A0A892ZIQ6_9NEIS|nr:hypothetical protein [Paralysiella testudinis]QRQ82318.1 hypothetical protein JQU52_02580 [Paralysiella testudinis]
MLPETIEAVIAELDSVKRFYRLGSFNLIVRRTCARQVPSLKQRFSFTEYGIGYFKIKV